ncbi:hypothetical protein DVS28_b0111 (plasmid) [Euzebya pacifica]|uniref:Uncharacterized protein n=1 Tax=Euzebya pacifica TaxID=1608957 RepID=A0A346Y5Y4_9ACTN|nr:hypothetical protein [Euzebya pacifica]AXV09881.1 hypothetical protein DVS28_b0111 [Euzebya pacifica]
MSTVTTQQWALTISHAHGIDAFVFDTQDEGLDHLHAYVTEWWAEELNSPIPTDRAEAIERYFLVVDGEDYALAPVIPTPKARPDTSSDAGKARRDLRAAQSRAIDTALADWTAVFAGDMRAAFPDLPRIAAIDVGFHDDIDGWFTDVAAIRFADGTDHADDGLLDTAGEIAKNVDSYWTWADVVHDDPFAEHKYGISGQAVTVTIPDAGPGRPTDSDDPDRPAGPTGWMPALTEAYRENYPNQTVVAVRVVPTADGPQIVEARTSDGMTTTGAVCDFGNDSIFEHPSFTKWAADTLNGPDGTWAALTDPADEPEECCAECGQPMFTGDDGVAHHFGGTVGLDDIDHDTDADHVPVADSTYVPVTAPRGRSIVPAEPGTTCDTCHAPATVCDLDDDDAPHACDDHRPDRPTVRPSGKARKKAIKAIKTAFPALNHQAAVNVVDRDDLATTDPASHSDVRAVIDGHTAPAVPARAAAAMLRLLGHDPRHVGTNRPARLTATRPDGRVTIDINDTDWSIATLTTATRTDTVPTGLHAKGSSPLDAALTVLRLLKVM